jgi:hypothetical protein
MTKRVCAILVVLAVQLFPIRANAQTVTAQKHEDTVGAWLKKNNVRIRKTFDGTAEDEGEPAQFSYTKPDTGESYYAAEVAVKAQEWDIAFQEADVFLSPVFEWHRSKDLINHTLSICRDE